MRNLFIFCSIIVAFLLSSITVNAQGWSDDQKAAWGTIETWWEVSQKKDSDETNALLADDFAGWDNNMPMPQNKSSLTSWFRFNGQYSTQLKYQIYPLKVTVHGDMAVAHYYYQASVEDKEGKRTNEKGRWTDTLVRDGNGWKFIAWQGGTDGE
ncbi:MAG: nuclear transport factor 2 family protein [Kordiimonadaceae bacterium]|nr:nuclear transport factor 2 family protein [Kordiimonadaceae bacterium]